MSTFLEAGPPRATITVHLRGGLGNQLFQYALGRSLSLANHAWLQLDASGYEKVDVPDPDSGLRMLALDHFNVVGTFLGRAGGGRSPADWVRRKVNKYWRKIVRLSERRKPYYLRREIVEPLENYFRFDPRLHSRRVHGDVFLEGFWQTEKYFADIDGTIRTELRVKDALDGTNKELADEMAATNSVCVHVRHGDNASAVAAALGVLPAEYFRKAVSHVINRVSEPSFFVFSDDIPWAKGRLLLDYPTTFVAHNGDVRNYEDLRLMSLCKHHIIGNSTFSWWGAWLGKNDRQVVCAPKRYYQNVDRPNPDLYPEPWCLL